MTSSAPLTDLALRTLHDSDRGAFLRLDAAARRDFEALCAMSPTERIAAMLDIIARAEALGPREPDRTPIRHFDMRM